MGDHQLLLTRKLSCTWEWGSYTGCRRVTFDDLDKIIRFQFFTLVDWFAED